jgi:hypothetical protein
MTAALVFLWARFSEPSTYAGLAAFCGGCGAALVSAGFTAAGAVLGALGAGCTAASIFLQEGKA